jgi:hypothetical protein
MSYRIAMFGQEAAIMPDEKTNEGGQDPGPIETGDVPSVGAADPGPIEVDVVMRDIVLQVSDPMAGRDLHIEDIGTEETR